MEVLNRFIVYLSPGGRRFAVCLRVQLKTEPHQARNIQPPKVSPLDTLEVNALGFLHQIIYAL